MMNFFKKKSDSYQELSDSFKNSLTIEQKAAIINSLILIAKADRKVHPKELKYIVRIAKLLYIELDDPIFNIEVDKGDDNLIQILNTLDQSQKEWLVITISGIIMIDGRVDENEVRIANGICKDIGISEAEVERICTKAGALIRKLGNA